MILHDEHPIERIMSTVMSKLKTLADADTIIGNPVVANGATIIPISKVTLGFLTGGGEYSDGSGNKKNTDFPFAGGSGAGVSIVPIGFLVDRGNGVQVVNMEGASAYEKLLGLVPGLIKSLFEEKPEDKKS